MRRAALPLLLAALLSPALAQAGALSVCTEASPEGFDVVQYNALTTTNASADVLMNRLVEFDATSGKVVPSLAESWTVSADGLVYDFKLRPGVKFHSTPYFKPSRVLNADDVLFSFQRMLYPAHSWHKITQSGYPHAQSLQLPSLIKQVEAPDPLSVRFTLDHPDATFLATLSMGFASIYSAEYADQLLKAGTTAELNSKPVGTGPFIFQRYNKDAQVRYRPNPDYFRGKPPSDALIFAITPDNNVRLQKLRANECQVALYPKPDDIPGIKADARLKVAEMEALTTGYISLNTEHRYLSDVRVRRAINLAFDREHHVEQLFGKGNALLAVNPYPPTLMGYNSQNRNPPRDLEQARALLKEAGVPEGTVLTLFTRNGGGPTNPNPRLSAEMLQADLAQVGLKVDIRVMEWAEMLRRAKAGEADMVSAGWAGDNGDPDNFLTPLLSCAAAKNGENYARWCNPRFQVLIDHARETADPDQRAALYVQALAVYDEAKPWINMAHPKVFTALRENVEGYVINPMTNNNFANTRVK
jgi:dipeptide transport system substrate-binding protein